jgi:hypothetical protein
MADFADIGLEATEAAIEDARRRQQARAKATETLVPTGSCRNPRCEDDTDKVFCSVACRDEYDQLRKRKQ